MVNLGDLAYRIVAKDESKGALDGAVGRIEKLTGLMAGIQVGQIVANAAVAVAGPVVDFFQSTVDASSNASEEISKFQQVFKDQAASGEDWIGKTAAEMGRSEGMVRSMAATFGAVLTPQMDGNRKKALELSEGYSKLAIDLSSFMNVSEDEAAQAISSAIAGETEPMRRFGVMLNEAAVNAELMAMGLNKTQKEASAAELQQARYNIILKATKDAQGDAVRTADGFANSVRALGAHFDQLKIAVGDAIMPIVKSLVQVAGGAVKEFMKIWEGLAPKITPILDGIGKGILEFAKSIGAAAMPAIQKIVDMLPGALSAIAGLFSKMGATAGPMLAQIFAGLPKVIDGALSTFKGLASAIGPVIQRIAADIAPIAREIGETLIKGFKAVSDWWSSNGAAVFKAIGDGLMGIVKFVEPIGAAIMSVLVPALQSIGKFWQESFGKIGEWWARDGQVIQQGFKVLSDTVGGALSTAIRVLGGLFNDYLLPPLEWLAGGILDVVLDGISEVGKWLASKPVADGIAGIAKGFEDLCTWLEPAGQWLKDAGGALADFIGNFLGTDPLHGFIDALGLVYEAIDLVRTALSGDIAGAATKWETLKTHFQEFGKAADPLPEKITGVNDELSKGGTAGATAGQGWRDAAGGLGELSGAMATWAANSGAWTDATRNPYQGSWTGMGVGGTTPSTPTGTGASGSSGSSGTTEPTWAGKGDLDYGGGDPNAWRNDPRLNGQGAASTREYVDAVKAVVPATNEADAATGRFGSTLSQTESVTRTVAPVLATEAQAVGTLATSTNAAVPGLQYFRDAQGNLTDMVMQAPVPLDAEATAMSATAAAAAAAGPSILALEQATIATVAAAAAVVPAATGAGTAIAGSGAAASGAATQIDSAEKAYARAKMAAEEANLKVLASKQAFDAAAGAANANAGQVEAARRAYDDAQRAAADAAQKIDESGRALARARQEAATANPVFSTTAGNLNSVKTSAVNAANSFVSMGHEYLTARNSIQSNPITSIHTIKTIVEGGGANVAPGPSATKYYPGAAKTSVLDRERATIKKFHSGGTYQAPAGASEGFAKLLDGERVLSRAETKEYEGGGIAAAVAAGIAKGLAAVGLGSGGGDVIVHGDVKLSEDYSYDRFREDVGRWKSSRIAKGVL